MSKLKIIPIGGLGEIGLNCMVFEYDDEILVVDCGVMFSDLQILGVDIVLPDMTYLKDNKDKIKAYIITHGHEDHIGALPFALKHHPAPIYCTPFAQKLIESRLDEHEIKKPVEFKNYIPDQEFIFKHFKVKAIPVNHSIIESMALFIDTPEGRIVFTGDFKIDTHPFYGKPMDSKPFTKIGDEGVLLLMSDSTNVERDGHTLSESTIYQAFDRYLFKPSGLTIIAVFASNIARIGQVIEIARKHGLKVAFSGRSMESNTAVAHELGYLEGMYEVLIPLEDIPKYDRNRVVVLSTGTQGEYRSALVRIANNEYPLIKLQEGDLVIMSSKFIPGNEKAIGRMINNLFKLGADVLYESVSDIHVSGHASADELRTMLHWTKPKFFIPVHGEYRHLVKHRKLAIKEGLPKENTVLAVNGDIVELSKDKIEIVDHMEENRVLVEGTGSDVSKVIIKDRRKVAETGVVFSFLIRNSLNGEIISGPELISKGFIEENEDSIKLMNRAKDVLLAIVEQTEETSKDRQIDLQEEIRIGLRRYFNSVLGKKPVVIPIVIDI